MQKLTISALIIFLVNVAKISGIKSQQDKEAQINRTELYQKIDAGVKFVIANAIERHRRLGESISILRDGKIVTLTADEIPHRDIHNII